MKRTNRTQRRNLTLCILAATLAAFVGCGKKDGAQDGQKNAEQQAQTLNPPQQFSPETLTQKALEAYQYLLDNQDYVQQAGDVKTAMAMAGMKPLREQLEKTPDALIENILREATRKATEEIKREQNIIPKDDIRHVVREKNPMINVRDRVTLPSIKGRMVTGMVGSITKSYIKVGATKIIRDDLPFDYRARIWPEENKEMIERTIRDQESRTHWALNKFLKPKLQKVLPMQFLKAGYLPNPRDPEANVRSIDTKHWIPRTRVLPLIAAEIKQGQQAKIEEFWTKKGYVREETGDGVRWVPAPKKNKK